MTEIVVLLVLMAVAFSGLSSAINHIPKTGRVFDAKGERITAVITNSNKNADSVATLRAKDAKGRRYKVKMKATEAKLWIKGDEISIILSENPKKYRVLFHEYFKENEPRMREYALEYLKKNARASLIAGRMVGYQKNSPEAFAASEADSQTIFMFATYMRMTDIYVIISAILAVAFVHWYMSFKPGFFNSVIPFVVLAVVILMINSTVNACKRVMETVNSKK